MRTILVAYAPGFMLSPALLALKTDDLPDQLANCPRKSPYKSTTRAHPDRQTLSATD